MMRVATSYSAISLTSQLTGGSMVGRGGGRGTRDVMEEADWAGSQHGTFNCN